jgi:magnesium-transporting ATPase (P-type)
MTVRIGKGLQDRTVHLTWTSSHCASSSLHNSACINMPRRYVLWSPERAKPTFRTATGHGLGIHIWLFPIATISQQVKSCILVRSVNTVPTACQTKALQYLYICQVLYAFAIALTKVAIISSYLRFIQNPTFRLLMYITAFVTAGLWVCGSLVAIFQCRPVSRAWEVRNLTKWRLSMSTSEYSDEIPYQILSAERARRLSKWTS